MPHAEQLAVLRMDEDGSQPNYAFCTPFFRGLEERHDLFADVFAFNGDTCRCRARSGNENIQGMLVSGQFFQALQTAAIAGALPDAAGRPAGRQSGRARGCDQRRFLEQLVQPRSRRGGAQDGHRQHAIHGGWGDA